MPHDPEANLGVPLASIVLNAVDLLSKYGFDDGDLIDDILDDNGFDSLARPLGDEDETCLDPGFGGAVLAECVRRRLAPMLIGFEIDYDLSIAHNPVRLAGTGHLDLAVVREALEGVSVTMGEAEILSIASEMVGDYVGARSGRSSEPPRIG